MALKPPPIVVLVLGAGASNPYGYPTGRELITEVVDGLEGENLALARLLRELGHEWHLLSEFRTDLLRAGLRSIDTFLTRRPEYRECGKQAIAATLLPREHHEALWRSPKLEWYEYLFDTVHPWILSHPQSLRIVTFNYDRSLERSLLNGMLSGLGMKGDDALAALDGLWVAHVHGHLGTLKERPYASKVDAPTVVEAAKRIRIVGEPLDISARKAAAWMDDVSKLVFLGFGFHSDNVGTLGLPSALNGSAKAFSTSIGLLDGEKAEASTMVGRTIDFGMPEDDCVTHLRRFAILSP